MCVCNAGSSTQMGRVRVFHDDGAGRLLGPPLWLDVPALWDAAAEAFDPETPGCCPAGGVTGDRE